MSIKPNLDYLAEDLRPIVQEYLDQVIELVNRAWLDKNAASHSNALRMYAAAMEKIRQHEWPL